MLKSGCGLALCLVLLLSVPVQAAEMQGELMFPLQHKHVHGSSIVECDNGDLLACWYHGSGERSADDVVIQGARLKKGSKTWSPVFLMADTPDFPDCNPVLFIDRNKKLWLFWVAVRANKWNNALLKYRTSEDYQGEGAPKWSWQDAIILKPGKDFSEKVKKGYDELHADSGLWAEYAPPFTRMIVEAAKDPAKIQEGWMTRVHPIQLKSGRILLPLYSDGFEFSLVGISDDDGKSWKSSGPIVGMGASQPSLVQKKDGTILSYHRDNGNAPKRVLQAISKDEGQTWTPAKDTEIPNPGSSVEVMTLKDGRWAMIYNDEETGRHSISMALSEDEGKTWKWKRKLDEAKPREGGFAYPSMIQSKDGRIHVSYTYSPRGSESIKHAVFPVDWIQGK
ncbi:MAG: sialidase family protein [Planctomycetales bacterium]